MENEISLMTVSTTEFVMCLRVKGNEEAVVSVHESNELSERHRL